MWSTIYVFWSVGAAGPVTKEAVKRISAALNAKEQAVAPYDLYEATIRKVNQWKISALKKDGENPVHLPHNIIVCV
jgi:hypothetical protein